MRLSLRAIFLSLGLGCLLTGCESKPPASSSGPSQTGASTKEESVSDATNVTARVVDAAAFQAEIAKHTGKVILIDCWATWCVPCREAFPHTVELSKKYAPEGLAVVSLSFDDPTEDGAVPAKVLTFLTDQQATFENYLSSAELGTPAAEGFQIEDATLPHYKLYDRGGKIVKVFSGGDPDVPMTPESIETAVKEALK